VNHTTQQSSNGQQRLSNFLRQTDAFVLDNLPHHFLDFCRHSIEGIKGNIAYTDPLLHSLPNMDDAENALDLESANGHLSELEPLKSDRPVVAIDTSTIKLGELEDGTLCALRGAIVWLDDDHYRYSRYGPLVFSLSNNPNASFEELTSLGLTPYTGETRLDIVIKRVRDVLERWLQYNVSSTVRNGIILVDGSLTAGTPDNPVKDLDRILQTARRAGNTVIAISKKTKLRIRNQSITRLLEHKSNPCLLDVDEEVSGQFPLYPVRFLGRVFVGKLAKGGFPFRIDVDRGLPLEDTLKSIRQLTGTDIVDQGYPETLRMAHILSTFTASEVLAMQVFTTNHFGVQLLPKLLLRRSLFGPFGTAWESYH